MTDDDPIAAFYTRFPYPWREPADEEGRFQWILPGCLPAIAHHVYGGVLPQGRPLRILVAGGGTGDAVVGLGGWLRRLGLEGQIDYLDLSERSCAIARKRAAALGLDTVRFEVGAIETLADRAGGIYDYIDLCGVLNHVPDPATALAALSHALAPGGGIGVMAYGGLGRSGVYEAQAALGMLGVDAGRPDGIALARAFVQGLPGTNWLLRNPSFANVAGADDMELADVLLNPRDRAFSTDDLDDLMQGAGLAIRSFAPRLLYDPARALREPALRTAAAALDRRARWRLAELIQGSCNKHVLYAVKPGGDAPDTPDADPAERLLDDPRTLLVPAGIHPPSLATSLKAEPEARRGVRIQVGSRSMSVGLLASDLDLAILSAIDGPTRVGTVLGRRDVDPGTAMAALRALQRRLTDLGALYVMAG
ncbi:class I SAM-dependent methyltransferase [Thalassobaculum sp.]|uniref:class I SAM-dependent methyltransferase n=1 Tax=Thalassobaculum sp. TaxID=2022740 RepID=UPI0032EB2BC8